MKSIRSLTTLFICVSALAVASHATPRQEGHNHDCTKKVPDASSMVILVGGSLVGLVALRRRLAK